MLTRSVQLNITNPLTEFFNSFSMYFKDSNNKIIIVTCPEFYLSLTYKYINIIIFKLSISINL